jgi:hypothetical protein
MAKNVQTTCYLVIEPTWSRWKNSDGNADVNGARVIAVRKDKPKLGQNQYAIKIRLDLPDSLFKRFIPEVKLSVIEGQEIQPGAAVLDPGKAKESVPAGDGT